MAFIFPTAATLNQVFSRCWSDVALYELFFEAKHFGDMALFYTTKKRTTCSWLMKTALNNVVLPTLLNVFNNIV